ncbi:MAG: small multi-drug export protein [Sphaerochaetaceae bacterium]|nr:small multi-drug export protein [Sphaerochaetaceae bacterium]
MDPTTIITTIVLAMLPISELRGAIPFAYLRGMDIWLAASLSIVFNALVAPVVYIFLSSLHKVFYKRWNLYQKIFDKTVVRARAKLQEKVNRYGYWGIMLFVAVPLPVTGAWTGTLGAWVLGLDKKKTMLAVCGGVLIAGIIVTTIVMLGAGMNSLFVKII